MLPYALGHRDGTQFSSAVLEGLQAEQRLTLAPFINKHLRKSTHQHAGVSFNLLESPVPFFFLALFSLQNPLRTFSEAGRTADGSGGRCSEFRGVSESGVHTTFPYVKQDTG